MYWEVNAQPTPCVFVPRSIFTAGVEETGGLYPIESVAAELSPRGADAGHEQSMRSADGCVIRPNGVVWRLTNLSASAAAPWPARSGTAPSRNVAVSRD